MINAECSFRVVVRLIVMGASYDACVSMFAWHETVRRICVYTRIGDESSRSFDNMLTSPKYGCIDLGYDPT